MKIVYLIGNGFDLNLGLKTGYYDFYKKYIKQKSKNDDEKNFKAELTKTLSGKDKKWSDFESAFGQYAGEFEDEKRYITLYDDIVDSLSKYIQSQNKEFDLIKEDQMKLKNDLFNFDKYLSNSDKQIFMKLKREYSWSSYVANVISFNYTQTFENLFCYKNHELVVGNRGSYNNILKSVMHIHGTTTKNLVLGVYDKEQINNLQFQKNKNLQDCLIKPQIYKNLGHMLDTDALALIKEANSICVFGMSFGTTDRGWWEAIVNRLHNSPTKLVVFGKSKFNYGVQGFRNEREKDEIKDHILSFSNLPGEEKSKIRSNIIISLDSDMFKLTNGSKPIKKQNKKTLNHK